MLENILKKSRMAIIGSFAVLGLSAVTCSDSDRAITCPEENQEERLAIDNRNDDPEITCFKASAYEVFPGQVIQLGAMALDRENDRIRFSYDSNGGRFYRHYPQPSNTPLELCRSPYISTNMRPRYSHIFWRCPERPESKVYTITVIAKDMYGHDKESIEVRVKKPQASNHE